MRRPSLALTSTLVALLLALTACSDSGSDGDGSRADGDDGSSLAVCGALDADDLEPLLGEPVTIEERRFLSAGICNVSGAEATPLLSIVSEARDAPIDEIVEELAVSSDSHTTETLELEGTLEAVELEDTLSGLSSRSLVATVEGGWYAVTTFVGPTREDERRVMVAMMTLLLGGEMPAGAVVAPVDVPHPCDLLDDAAVSRVLGQVVVSVRNDAVEELRQCLYRPTADPASSVSVSDFTDRPSVEGFRGLEDRLGSVEDVVAPGLVEAFVGVRDDDPGRVTAWAATQEATYQVTPDRDSEDALEQARALLELLGAASAAQR